jgi:ATP-dependent Clp protease protease subunit
MVHQPSGGAQGQASDIAIQAAEILYLRNQLNSIYVKHTGRTLEEVEKSMERDTYMSSEQAKEFGLVDHVTIQPPSLNSDQA